MIGNNCLNNWVEYRDSCYTATRLTDGISWIEAERQCNDNNAHLVSITDEEEMQVIHYLIMTILGTAEPKTYLGML